MEWWEEKKKSKIGRKNERDFLVFSHVRRRGFYFLNFEVKWRRLHARTHALTLTTTTTTTTQSHRESHCFKTYRALCVSGECKANINFNFHKSLKSQKSNENVKKVSACRSISFPCAILLPKIIYPRHFKNHVSINPGLKLIFLSFSSEVLHIFSSKV